MAVLAVFVSWTSARAAQTVVAASPQSQASTAAASFACAHAASALERVICGDPALSDLDGQLGRLYSEKRARLSPEGAKRLRESELGWLRFVKTVCSSDDPDSKPGLSRTSCLMTRYHERLRELQWAADKVGPYLFNRIDLYAAQPSEDKTGSAPGFYIQHTAYPQIDNANSPELRAWNEANVRHLSHDGSCDDPIRSDYDRDYEIGYANARFISAQWTERNYCHGTPHGFGGYKSNNSLLQPSLRPISPEDLFGSGNDWAVKLREIFWATLSQTGWRPPAGQPNVQQQLEDDFVEPDRWLFTKDGMQVAFISYEGGCYACTPGPVTIPWSQLSPLLSKGAVVP